MAGKGGRRPGAGRKKGIPNRATQKRADTARKALASGLTPLDYMLKVMRNVKAEPARRDDMAKASAPYIHPRLAAVEHTGKGGGPIVIRATPTDERL